MPYVSDDLDEDAFLDTAITLVGLQYTGDRQKPRFGQLSRPISAKPHNFRPWTASFFKRSRVASDESSTTSTDHNVRSFEDFYEDHVVSDTDSDSETSAGNPVNSYFSEFDGFNEMHSYSPGSRDSSESIERYTSKRRKVRKVTFNPTSYTFRFDKTIAVSEDFVDVYNEIEEYNSTEVAKRHE